MSDQKVMGPASYFPSIEKKYGRSIGFWLDAISQRSALKHMEVVDWLKTEHGMGHGHANALVGYLRRDLGGDLTRHGGGS